MNERESKLQAVVLRLLQEPTQLCETVMEGPSLVEHYIDEWVCNHCGNHGDAADMIDHADDCDYVAAKAALWPSDATITDIPAIHANDRGAILKAAAALVHATYWDEEPSEAEQEEAKLSALAARREHDGMRAAIAQRDRHIAELEAALTIIRDRRCMSGYDDGGCDCCIGDAKTASAALAAPASPATATGTAHTCTLASGAQTVATPCPGCFPVQSAAGVFTYSNAATRDDDADCLVCNGTGNVFFDGRDIECPCVKRLRAARNDSLDSHKEKP